MAGTLEQKYRQAAVTYFLYGVIYLGGATYIAETGFSERTAGPGGGAVWFLTGALLVLVLPPLIWKRYKWLTRILAVLVLVRVIGLADVMARSAGRQIRLPWGAEMPVSLGAGLFLLIAAATGLMLARAGWDLDLRRTAQGSRASIR